MKQKKQKKNNNNKNNKKPQDFLRRGPVYISGHIKDRYQNLKLN